MKRSPLRRKRAKPARVIEADIWREGMDDLCVMHVHSNCDGRRDAHHAITRQALRKHGYADRQLDKANRMTLCRRHHDLHHSRAVPVPRELLPASVLEFAADVELAWLLERTYPRTCACGKPIAAVLDRLGSVSCHDCRDDVAA